jgi:PEP-CTERM motif
VGLTSAFKIDDLGRILAQGSDGHDYLLTPTALGSPETVPEPSSVMVFGVVGSLLGLRSIRRRKTVATRRKWLSAREHS